MGNRSFTGSSLHSFRCGKNRSPNGARPGMECANLWRLRARPFVFFFVLFVCTEPNTNNRSNHPLGRGSGSRLRATQSTHNYVAYQQFTEEAKGFDAISIRTGAFAAFGNDVGAYIGAQVESSRGTTHRSVVGVLVRA